MAKEEVKQQEPHEPTDEEKQWTDEFNEVDETQYPPDIAYRYFPTREEKILAIKKVTQRIIF